MRVFREPEPDYGREALSLALGAVGGLALGLLFSRRDLRQPAGALGHELRERARQAGDRARSAVRRMEPQRLQRVAREQTDLLNLEDDVLEAFFADHTLSERGIDVGAISVGIVELSGSVWTEAESERAVRVASSIPGVRTVVNRLEVEEEDLARARARRSLRVEAGSAASIQREISRTGGMGSRRQSSLTDPDRPDDSQHREQRSLRRADRDQWVDEGYAARNPRSTQSSEIQDPWRSGYDEDELDNQDPHGKHARNTLDAQPQELNTDARTGDAAKPGTELDIEQSGLRAEGFGGEEDRGESN
jgi:hypothetical protein